MLFARFPQQPVALNPAGRWGLGVVVPRAPRTPAQAPHAGTALPPAPALHRQTLGESPVPKGGTASAGLVRVRTGIGCHQEQHRRGFCGALQPSRVHGDRDDGAEPWGGAQGGSHGPRHNPTSRASPLSLPHPASSSSLRSSLRLPPACLPSACFPALTHFVLLVPCSSQPLSLSAHSSHPGVLRPASRGGARGALGCRV